MSVAIYVGLFLLAAVFSETNRPKPAHKHRYGIKEWLTITLVTYVIMVVVFQWAIITFTL